MRRLTWVLTILVLAAGVPVLSGDEPDQQKMQLLMKKKLLHAQKVLEGIALNDHETIARNAEELMRISQAVEWRVLKSPQYEVHSNEFRRGLEGLTQAAKTKNVDAAALAYVDLTLTCVRCHKHVREVRQTRLERLERDQWARRD
ncbi:MAG: hypothetical protein NZ700_17595 [Gemmataceae bacterium]|nr:hypothetical protein [Gemmataceae bacterium]MDW8266136.1 hypothetical protein [Gemmataceae bacterium]